MKLSSNKISTTLATLALALAAFGCQKSSPDSALSSDAGATYAGDIRLSLAHPVNVRQDDFDILLSVPASVAKMAVCEVRVNAECKENAPYRFDTTLIYLTTDRHYFKSTASALLEDGLILKIEALDDKGTAVDSRLVQIKRTDGQVAAAAVVPSLRPVVKDDAGKVAQPKQINADRDAANANVGAGSGRANGYKAPPAGYGDAQVSQWVKAHQAAKGQGFKYVFIPAESAANRDEVNVLRIAAGKAWNHLSWLPDIDLPEDVSEGAGLVFALNAHRSFGAPTPTRTGRSSPTARRSATSESRPAPRGDCETFDANAAVDIPRFVFNATNGGPYAEHSQDAAEL